MLLPDPLHPPGLEPVASPVDGYREWDVVEEHGGWLLRGVAVGAPWRADVQGACRAGCVASPPEAHPAPALACRCGFYLLRHWPPRYGGVVRGRATGWGRLVEHEHGWRAQWARPEHLLLSCDDLRRTWPGARPEVVRADLAARYGCAVDLVDDDARPTPPAAAAVMPVSLVPLLLALAAAPGLLVQGGTPALVATAWLATAVALLPVVGLHGSRPTTTR